MTIGFEDNSERLPPTSNIYIRPKPTRLNKIGEIEGYLSLLFPLWLLLGSRPTCRIPNIFNEFELMGMGISIGLAVGAVHFGCFGGRTIGYFVLFSVGSLAAYSLVVMILLKFF